MLRVLPLLLACSLGCASWRIQPGVADASDRDFGGGVRLRASTVAWPALMTCKDVAGFSAPRGWNIIYTAGAPGWVLDRGMRPREALAMTYPQSQVVMVSAYHQELLEHELGHVSDVLALRPNFRDTWRAEKGE